MSLVKSSALAFGLVFLSTSAFAATTDTLSMSGTVASTLAVDCTDTAGAMALDFDGGSAVTIIKVSDCTATTNDDAGLTVTFTPSASFAGQAADVFLFAVESVADAATAPVAGDFGADAAVDTFATSASGGTAADVYVKFTQSVAADPGTYTATIAVTSADNS